VALPHFVCIYYAQNLGVPSNPH